MKKVIKYIGVFLITVSILFIALVGTAKIPREYIKENIKKSADELKIEKGEIDEIIKGKDYTYRHVYADAMILNIIWCIDTNNTIESAMEAKYYSKYENKLIPYDLQEVIEKGYEGNVQYLRYWHGSISILRPLLVFFDLGQIYIINAIILIILMTIFILLIWKTKIKELILSFSIAGIMCMIIIVPFCLEYTWTFMIMLITSILAIVLERKQKDLKLLFFITGIITCYFDFLSTEIITLFVPIITILTIRYKEKRIQNFGQGIKFVASSTILWGMAYIGMWIAKWVLASVILKINAWFYVKEDMLYRINGYSEIIENLRLKAISKNVLTLYPLEGKKIDEKFIIIPIIILIFEMIFIRKKEIKKLWISGLLLIIASIPYIRYWILAEHSYAHYFFTFRSQIITIMAIILAMIYSWDIKFIKKRKKDGINNIDAMSK